MELDHHFTVPAPIEEEGKQFGWAQHAKATGVLVLGLAYLIALPWIGYLLGMAILVTVVAIYIGARPSLYTVAVGVGVAVIVISPLIKRLMHLDKLEDHATVDVTR